jgi:hypothetical protein
VQLFLATCEWIKYSGNQSTLTTARICQYDILFHERPSNAKYGSTHIISRNKLIHQPIYINEIEKFLMDMTDGNRIKTLLSHSAA